MAFDILKYFNENNPDVHFIQVADDFNRRFEKPLRDGEVEFFALIYSELKSHLPNAPGFIRHEVRIRGEPAQLTLRSYGKGWFVSID